MARTLSELQKQYNKGGAQGGRGFGPMGGRARPGMGAGGKGKPDTRSVKRLFSYLAPYKFRLAAVVLFMILSTGSTIIGSFAVKSIVDGLVYSETRCWFRGTAFEISFSNPAA